MPKYTHDDLYDEDGGLFNAYENMSDDDRDDEVNKMNDYGEDYMPPQN